MIHTKSPLKKACNITDIVWRIDYLPTTMHKKTNIALNVAKLSVVTYSDIRHQHATNQKKMFNN